MGLEAALLGEPLSTAQLLAWIGLFLQMDGLDMTVQIRLLTEQATAALLCALKIPLAAMDELHVLGKIAILLKTSAALLATVRLIAGAFMFFVSSGGGECAVTLCAFPWGGGLGECPGAVRNVMVIRVFTDNSVPIRARRACFHFNVAVTVF